ncbi:hypothetical protein NPIL_550101 [Nephila pilipes]|uniref:RRM domain-containing protein n=1 Tax=Nephila pilipes TaxID=299642 RepID=A0A8X6UND3_NEPPI|nr:hypothetical protein NPIL_550101 [Nephila pilipes]
MNNLNHSFSQTCSIFGRKEGDSGDLIMLVTMSDRDSAERAVKDANPIIDGRKANVNLAYLGAKPRINAQNGKASFSFQVLI